MSVNERSLATSAGISTQSGSGPSGGPNHSDEQVEPSSTLGIFSLDYKKHEDIKQMLDSNKDNLKLDAMRRIIGMIAKGKDAADLFPAVVKNVVSKNMEIKKLVYVYLMRYAEEQQDLALLSIATFQRGLKDPNQLIRASALRVLSSIRVPTIVTIMMLAIREAANDMSAYVRKTAANAIAKLYALDPEMKDELILIIAKLLADKTILVNGSAVQAFEHVCPERIDLIHKNYRRLCNLLVDIDEWGQVTVLNMLTRYARTQFVDPNKTYEDDKKDFYGDDDTNEKEKNLNDDDDDDSLDKRTYVMDSDHRLLLRCTKPLLQNRNSAVVMAVAQLYYYVAPRSEVQIVAKSLIRLLRYHREIQTIVLESIASMADKHKQIFEPYLKSFYVHSNDSSHVKRYKLEILTVLANASNISTILREFQTYVVSPDKEFGAQTIHAIGRCASTIPEVTEACLNGLVTLMSKKDEKIVAESVVVIKKLLQINPSQYSDIIKHIVRMVDKVTVPTARASILWLIGEYSDRVSKLAPDVLRKMAKTFPDEETIVKHQILNLAAKLYVINNKQTHLLVQYVFNLAKYDTNYDTRDKARLLRALLLQTDKSPTLSKYAKKILLAPKPAPILESIIRNHEQYTLGTLSYVIGQKAAGYKDLPDFPLEPADPSVRNVEIIHPLTTQHDQSRKSSATSGISSSGKKKIGKSETFYSDEEGEEEEEESSTEGPDDDENESEEDEEEEEKSTENVDKTNEYEQLDTRSSDMIQSQPQNSTSSEEESEEEEEEEEEEESTDEDERIPQHVSAVGKSPSTIAVSDYTIPAAEKSLLEMDLESFLGSTSTPTTIQQTTKNNTFDDLNSLQSLSTPSPTLTYIRQYDCLNRITGQGLQIQYRFPRTPYPRISNMVHIELIFTNTTTNKDIQSIKFIKSKSGVNIDGFNDIDILPSNASIVASIGVDFNDKTQSASFDISFDGRQLSTPLSISCHVGELFEQKFLNEQQFTQNLAHLRGMNEITDSVNISETQMGKLNFTSIQTKVLQCANVTSVPLGSGNSTIYRFSGQTISSKALVLITIQLKIPELTVNLIINSDRIVLATMLLKEIKQTFSTMT
ncbi:unnamed protein product [Rotaria sp. Silwood2]|nr:unnamed protein product [Rotaria sp. Silwood2]CAF2612264.1 unnamed protein product [Rotaria sp. Silwood2]CAF3025489.1 unnamed protein product [Rotaria sp. Silwood2]CAF3865478.1 unnamed protein product [Rotaria sp. Silwood2]CAF3870487.1 unnamed protein product [Rotaria sp. Silwood2]